MGNQREWPRFITHFWSRIRRSGDDKCWLWSGAQNSRGYGTVGWRDPNTGVKTMYSSHRLAYHFTHGAPPAGMCVMHICDNPPCCNPAHLTLGTVAENNRDRAAKGRNAKPGTGKLANRDTTNQPRGSQSPRAKLTEDKVRRIWAELEAGHKTQYQIAEAFGVSQSTIMTIKTGRHWKHVRPTLPLPT